MKEMRVSAPTYAIGVSWRDLGLAPPWNMLGFSNRNRI